MRSLVLSTVVVAASALVAHADPRSLFNHTANPKIDVKLSDRVTPPQKHDNPDSQTPTVTGDDILQIEELLSPIQSQQEEVLRHLIDITRDDDPDKPKYLFMLGETYAKQQRTARLLAADADIKLGRTKDPAQKAKLSADSATSAKQAHDAMIKAVRTYKELTDNTTFRNFPQMDTALFYYGYTLQHSHYLDEARAIYDRLLKEYPASKHVPEANLAFAEYYFEAGQYANAEERYKKVLQFPQSSAYWFAMYKTGWIQLQFKKPQGALEIFYKVAEHTNDPKQQILNRAAKKDFVRAYAEVGKVDKALAAFRRVDPKEPYGMLATLAGFYYDQGKFDRAIYAYRELMTGQPKSSDVCFWQYSVARSMLVVGTGGDKIHEIENLTRLYGALRGGKQLPKDQASECHDNASEMSGQLARAFHQEAVKTKNPELVGYADRLYRAYLAVFTDAPDFADTQYYRAELDWIRADMEHKDARLQTQLWSEAAVAFTNVVETKKLSPALVKISADAAMQAWMKALAIDPRVHQNPLDEASYDKIPTPKPIPEMDQKLIAAYDLYVKYVTDPKDDELIEVKFLEAEAYRKHDHLDEAITRFADILEHSRNHEVARFSAQLILDSYNRLHRYDEMFAWAEKLSADKPFMAANEEVRTTIDKLLRQRMRKHAQELEEIAKKTNDFPKFVECGDAFLDVYNHEVEASDADTMLYNAGVCYEEGRSLGAAKLVYEMLAKLFPKSKLTAHSIVRLGSVYASIAFYREASDKFEEYAKSYAGEDDAFKALNDAVVLRKGVGDDARAIADTMLFIERFGGKRSAMAAQAFFSLNAIYDKQGDSDQIVKHLRAYVAKFAEAGGADRLVMAWAKIGQALWQSSCPVKTVDGSCIKVQREAAVAKRMRTKVALQCGDETKIKVTVVARDDRKSREAMVAFDHAIGELDKHNGKTGGDERGALFFYATSKLVKAERDYEQYLALQLPTGLSFDKNQPALAARSQKRFGDWFKSKLDKGVAIRKQYDAVIALADGPTTIAAAARVGQTLQNFSGQLFRAEIPIDVRTGPYAAEASESYCDALTEKAEPLETDALNLYQACLNTSKKLGWFSEYSRICERELGQLRPELFPTASEMHRDPDQVSQIVDVEPARKLD